MKSGYSEAQREIHPNNTNQDVGYLGPHEKILEIGDEQNMVFQEGDDVSLWTTPQKRSAMKFSQYYVPQLTDKKQAELLGYLKSAGVNISILKGNKVGELKDIACKI